MVDCLELLTDRQQRRKPALDSVRLDATADGALFEGTREPDSFCEAADLLEAAMNT